MTQPPSVQQRQQLVSQLAPILAAGSVEAVAPTVITSLAAVGVSAAAASAALTLIGASSASTVLPTGVASRATAASEHFYRAAYLVSAANRIQTRMSQGVTRREALLAERGVFKAHVAAQANRRRAAQLVDGQAERHGGLLGWHAVMDDRTSAECRRANGRNFLVSSRPVIGWPGSVHPSCRCRPGAPHAGAALVDQVITSTQRREAAVA